MNLTGKKIAVLGAGRSGLAAARFVKARGAEVCIFDHMPCTNIQKPQDIPLVTSATEQQAREYAPQLVIISPGVETLSPFVQAFCESADELIGETELACRFYSGKIIAITGTNGKTTTTALLESILQQAGINAVACGNYGTPTCELLMDEVPPAMLVMEVSSFQMETIRDFHPNIAIWLNFAPDHMDRYTSEKEYYEAKLHIFDNLTQADLSIVRAGEKIPELQARMETFSSEISTGTLHYKNKHVMRGRDSIIDLTHSVLAHKHNAENVMACTLACLELGIPLSAVQNTVNSFTPPGHRCEKIPTADGIEWLNDSKATNLHALEAALKSQTKPVILIAGGKDKGLDYSPIIPLLREKTSHCIVFGEIAEQLFRTFSQATETHKCTTLDDCVLAASSFASDGDTILFSPGTSSFDMFSGYVQRGHAFRDAVLSIQPSHPHLP